MQKTVQSLRIEASVERVFWALTALDGLAGWWSERVSIQEPFGGVLHFEFVTDFSPEMEVVRVEANQQVEWKCVGGHAPWRDHTFLFRLRSDGEATGLYFEQAYAFDLDDEVFGMYCFNWGQYLASLKDLCETGAGRPYLLAG